jgi:hypothetical protein
VPRFEHTSRFSPIGHGRFAAIPLRLLGRIGLDLGRVAAERNYPTEWLRSKLSEQSSFFSKQASAPSRGRRRRSSASLVSVLAQQPLDYHAVAPAAVQLPVPSMNLDCSRNSVKFVPGGISRRSHRDPFQHFYAGLIITIGMGSTNLVSSIHAARVPCRLELRPGAAAPSVHL